MRHADAGGLMTPQEERFWAKVDRSGRAPAHAPGLGACWLWTACKSAAGYGFFGMGDRNMSSHRVAWMLTSGPIPPGMWVLHRCDNPSCVRPDHLFLGTPTDNVRDMFAKGRARPQEGDDHWFRRNAGVQVGEGNFNAILSAADVLQIKRRLIHGETPALLAASFGVGTSTICQIQAGRNWNSVPWPDGASMSIDCEAANRSRWLRRHAATECAIAGCGTRPRRGSVWCEACWQARRKASKRAYALARRAA